MKMKWLALLLAGVMCVCAVPGMAEDIAAFDVEQVMPLLNAVTSAALGAEEAVTLQDEEEVPPEGFLPRLLKALQDNGLGASAVGDLVAMPLQEQSAAEDVAPMTFRVLASDQSQDGDAVMLLGEAIDANGQAADARVTVELRREDASPLGWKLYRFVVGDTMVEEDLLGGHLAEMMLEYMNAAYGYSIQYPAIFTEDTVTETPTGIQAVLKDETASFSVGCSENADGLTLDDLLKNEQALDATAQVSVDEATGSGKSVVTDEEGTTHVAVFLVSDGYIYQAELNFPAVQAEDYASYADYMINSFSADELGHG